MVYFKIIRALSWSGTIDPYGKLMYRLWGLCENLLHIHNVK